MPAAAGPRDELARDLADADALVVRSATKVTAALIAAAPRLRVIARAGTGVDNVDVPAATERGIVVMNAPGANSISVAELAVALMLALSRAIPAADASMKQGVWEKKKLTGAELRGKTLGIVGLGRIGQEVATRARAVRHERGGARSVHLRTGGRRRSARAAVARRSLRPADYITLHLPATPETRHLFNAARLARCKAGVRIINTARGELIDEAALADAIEARHVAGAGLDVFESEPPTDWRLAELPQVVATPHIAASTVEAQELVGIETALALRDYLRDGVIRNAVNFPGFPARSSRASARSCCSPSAWARSSSQTGRRPDARRRHPLLRRRSSAPTATCLAAPSSPGCSGRSSPANVTVVNARAIAAERGIEIVESRSSRPRRSPTCCR